MRARTFKEIRVSILQDAVNVVGEYCKHAIDRFVRERDNTPSWGPAIDADVHTYVDGLADWIVAPSTGRSRRRGTLERMGSRSSIAAENASVANPYGVAVTGATSNYLFPFGGES